MTSQPFFYSGTIYLGADHGGFHHKESIKSWLKLYKIEVIDCGASAYDPDDDYPVFALKVANEVADQTTGTQDRALGLLFCRSGGGMAIIANKVKGIRAVEVRDVLAAEHARSHNHANVLAFSADWLEVEEIKNIILKAFNTDWSNDERHLRRLELIRQVECST
ncbi:MAG TPA: RpiB/LacA/LacB family sugar-phosphate isomerase [Candidatus Woesebacteria bacterium]|nr:RpiB/LacA/LacB family sugar-phosphate isomerase [Candidatus Woesebacteria bacterium]